ncbi:MAG: hypothetical protein RL077_6410 [Verrucomicrobiota bacterium]|jgi:LysM repeat protein
MTVRPKFLLPCALLVTLLVAGCGDRDRVVTMVETDDPFFVQGRQLQKQGRNPEALTAFLKVIEKRGERASAESHFEVAQIYLNHTKEPVEAYHHFKKYLELQPNSRQADLVRGMAKVALREFARTLPGRPMDDQSIRMQSDDEIAKLRRDNDELRAELAVVRGGGGLPLNRGVRMITLPLESRAAPIPVPTTPVVDGAGAAGPRESLVVPTPSGAVSAPEGVPARASVSSPGIVQPSPARAATPLRPPAVAPRTAPGRTHTVAPKETLFSISKRYGTKMEDIFAMNRDVMRTMTDLRPGVVLKIPAVAGGSAAPIRR